MTWPYRVNVLDLEPRGPLPPEIYWRRRGLAIGVAVVVIAIVVAIIVAVLSGSAGANTSNAAKKPTQAGQGAPGTNPEVKSPVEPPAGENTDQPAETPTAAVQPPPVLKEGDDCPDSTLAVKGLTNAPQYAIGDQPKFVMVVTNIGLVACKRDVGAAVLAAYVYSLDNKRLWSNLDCAPSNETLVKTFAPGEQVTTSVTWTGMGSARTARCRGRRSGPVPTTSSCSWAIFARWRFRSSWLRRYLRVPRRLLRRRGCPARRDRDRCPVRHPSPAAELAERIADGRFGQLRQSFSHVAGPDLADAFHGFQVARTGRQQALQRAELADQPVGVGEL